MDFAQTRFVKKDKLEFRGYQDRLSSVCLNQNCLIIAPTGLGKTIIASLFIAKSLMGDEKRRYLMIAPTRVLVGQHAKTLQEVLDIDAKRISEITGEDNLEERKKKWNKDVVVATAEVALSDFEKGILKLEDFYSIIFDEAHHAIGNHPYSLLGRNALIKNPKIRVIGFTASPPIEYEDREQMLSALNIEHIEKVTENSSEIRSYFLGSKIEVVKIKLTPALTKIRKDIMEVISVIKNDLIKKGILPNQQIISLKELLKLGRKELSSEDRSKITSLIRLYHCQEIIESYGIEPFISFCDKIFLKKGKSATELKNSINFKAAYETAKSMLVVGEEHPKVVELRKVLSNMSLKDRVIVFTNYKDTAKMLYEKALSWGLEADFLIGKRGELSQSQKEQLETLTRLNKGEKKILFATRVGEEGLDIIECNLVIFYDSVSDAIRFIQRKGRTGRKKKGRVIALITEGTREEVMFWVGKKRMKKGIEEVENLPKNASLEQFIKENAEAIKIYVDKRENSSIKQELSRLHINLDEQMLDIGDFVLSEEVCVERKTVKDFIESIIDGRLFPQLIQLKQRYVKPLLLLEKGTYSDRITQHSFLGALASIITDFNIPLVVTESTEESAALLYAIAKREQSEKKKGIKIREGEKPLNIKDVQKYILAGIPGVSAILAGRLLEKFDTLQNIFNASEEELMEVKGIGEVLAKRIRNIVTKSYNQ